MNCDAYRNLRSRRKKTTHIHMSVCAASSTKKKRWKLLQCCNASRIKSLYLLFISIFATLKMVVFFCDSHEHYKQSLATAPWKLVMMVAMTTMLCAAECKTAIWIEAAKIKSNAEMQGIRDNREDKTKNATTNIFALNFSSVPKCWQPVFSSISMRTILMQSDFFVSVNFVSSFIVCC